MKSIIAFFTATAFFYSCQTVAQADKRKEIINDFIAAIKSNDTTQLYSIIDTSAYFDIQNREHLFYQMGFLKSKFMECGSNVIDSTIKVSHRDIPFTDYTYSFCSNVKEKEFEIRFSFSDFENKSKINYIEIKSNYRSTTPTAPIQ